MQTTPQSSQSEIEEYQRLLQRAGRYLGPIDGIWGPQTQRANDAYVAAANAGNHDDGSNTAAALEGLRSSIITTAEHFLNLTETSPNARWDDVATSGQDPRGNELRQALLDTGWQLGWPYCAAFAEVCWRVAYRNRSELALITRSITPSAMGTFENFERLGRITQSPRVGALMLMQHGGSWQGHVGIVTDVDLAGRIVKTIEGNTSAEANAREGDGVYRKHHALGLGKSTGLWIRGFVNPFLI